MTSTEELRNKIKTFEGFHGVAYRCASGSWAIGYGHTGAGIRAGMTITEDIADSFLRADIENVERALSRFGLPELTQGQWDAIVSFSYNLGAARFRSSVICAKIRKNPSDKRIANEFQRWITTNGKIDRSLVKRRTWEAKRYFGAI